jgi:hypothetical protein
VTLRPKWSKISPGTPAWKSHVRLIFVGALVASCSALDPNIGTRRNPLDVNGGGDGATPPGQCASINPGEVCFATDIRPIINRPSDYKEPGMGKGCKSCHYSTEARHVGLDLGGLDLATLGALRKGGGSSGSKIVVAGRPAESVLVQVLRGQYGLANRMPKNGPFWGDMEIELVERWIAEGAKGADDE